MTAAIARAGFLRSTGNTVWWDSDQARVEPFAGGARGWQVVLADLARLFGPEAAQPVGYFDQDWTAETWTGGCSAGYAVPGALSHFGAAQRAPVGRIHWAGSETAREWFGYMEGALESGERAAREVIDALAG